jgi:hypothetical protein
LLEVKGDGKITLGSSDYTMANTPNERLITLDPNLSYTFKFTSNTPAVPISVLLDGLNITSKLDENNQITLKGISEDTVLTAVYDGSAFTELIYDNITSDYKAKALVNTRNAALVVAGYTAAGRLIGLEQVTSNVATPTWRTLSVEAEDILTNPNLKTVRVFLWDSVTFTPIVSNLTVN